MSDVPGVAVLVHQLASDQKVIQKKDFSVEFYVQSMKPLMEMAAANYLSGSGKISTEQEFQDVLPYLQENLKNNIDYVGMAYYTDTKVFVGYIFGLRNRIMEIYVDPMVRQRGIGALMINQFKQDRFQETELFQAKWEHDPLGALTKLFGKCGFDVVLHNDVFNNSLQAYYAEAPGNPSTAESILDGAEKSYIDFRGTYAVVDEHYTLAQLEALLTLARKELKHAE